MLEVHLLIVQVEAITSRWDPHTRKGKQWYPLYHNKWFIRNFMLNQGSKAWKIFWKEFSKTEGKLFKDSNIYMKIIFFQKFWIEKWYIWVWRLPLGRRKSLHNKICRINFSFFYRKKHIYLNFKRISWRLCKHYYWNLHSWNSSKSPVPEIIGIKINFFINLSYNYSTYYD